VSYAVALYRSGGSGEREGSGSADLLATRSQYWTTVGYGLEPISRTARWVASVVSSTSPGTVTNAGAVSLMTSRVTVSLRGCRRYSEGLQAAPEPREPVIPNGYSGSPGSVFIFLFIVWVFKKSGGEAGIAAGEVLVLSGFLWVCSQAACAVDAVAMAVEVSVGGIWGRRWRLGGVGAAVTGGGGGGGSW